MFIYSAIIEFLANTHYKNHWEPSVEKEWGGD